jgi:hypothetical protein
MLGGHGGNIYEVARRLGCAPSEFIDMSSNINPLGPPPGLVNYLEKNIDTINNKFQISNNKQITMTKIQNPKRVLVIEYWNLRFICNLVLGIWDFNIRCLEHWMFFQDDAYLFRT